MRFRFILVELLNGPAKKEVQKRKRSNGETKTKEGGMATHRDAPASTKGIAEVIPRVSAIDPRQTPQLKRPWWLGLLRLP